MVRRRVRRHRALGFPAAFASHAAPPEPRILPDPHPYPYPIAPHLSYAFLEMRFVAMDGFQRSFFLKRQEEWQPYLNMVDGLVPKQGDLQDPSYFDFISFSQYASLGEAMQDGRMAFVERVGAEGELVTRRRPADVPEDNALLPAEHRKRVGDIIYRWLPTATR